MNSSNVRSSSLHSPLLSANERDSSSIPRDSIFGSSSSSEGQKMTVLENSSSSASTSSSEKSLTPSSEDKVRGVARKLLFEEDAPEEINYKEEPPTEGDSTDVNEAAPAQGWCSYLFGKVKSCASAAIDAVGQFWKSRDPCVKETVCCVAGCGTAVAAGFSAPGSSSLFAPTKRKILQSSAFFTGLFCQSAVSVRGWDESADNTEDTTKPLCERKIAEELIRQEATLRRYGQVEYHSNATASAGAPDRLPPVADHAGDGQLVSEGDADVEMQSALIAKDEQQADQPSVWAWGCCSPLTPPADGLVEYPNMPRNCYELGMSILEKLGDCKERPWTELKRAWLWLIEYKPTELVWTLNSLVFLIAYFKQGEVFTGLTVATILTAGAGVHLANILHRMANRASPPEHQRLEGEHVGCCDLIKRVVSSCGKAIKECGKCFALRAVALAALQVAGIYLAVTNFNTIEGFYPDSNMIFGNIGTIITAGVPAYIIAKMISCGAGPCLERCPNRYSAFLIACANKMPLLLAATGNSVLSGSGWVLSVPEYRRMVWAGLVTMGMATGVRFVLPVREPAGARIARHPRKWADRTFLEKALYSGYKLGTSLVLSGYAISGLINKSGYVNAAKSGVAILSAMVTHSFDQYIKDKRIELILRAEGESSLFVKLANAWLHFAEYLPFTILANFQAFYGEKITEWDTFMSYSALGVALGLSSSDRTDQKNRDDYQEPLVGRDNL